MIEKQDLIRYFSGEGNMITSVEGVELALHGDSLIEVSVMLRNVLDIALNDGVPMLQLCVEFDDFSDFQRVMKIAALGDLHEVSLADMLRLYRDGLALLYKAQC